jgi:alpha-amylase
LESVFDGIAGDGLPQPGWILCDVGTSIYERPSTSAPQPTSAPQSESQSESPPASASPSVTPQTLADQFQRVVEYDRALDTIVGQTDINGLRMAIGEFPGFRLQEDFKQGRHKLSYYVDAGNLGQCHRHVEAFLADQSHPYSVISSIDPFNGDGLIDVLPKGVSKAFALNWWCEQNEFKPSEVIFCGDSGNDLAALVAGYRAVVVANADRSLAEEVLETHSANDWKDRLLLAKGTSTSGVLEGLRWFGLMPNEHDNEPKTGETAISGNANWDAANGDATSLGAANWGAVPLGHDITRFRVFAPAHESVYLHLDQLTDTRAKRTIELQPTRNGWHTRVVENCPAGTRYQLSLGRLPATSSENEPPFLLPDAASRFQPDGVHGPSEVVHPQFAWKHDAADRITRREDLIIYELHLGAFTESGTCLAAIDRLDELVELGVTAIELMPIVECPGRWNWGYDGTHWFAPMHTFGGPNDLRRFIDEAHGRGLLVFADVVYNHFGPEGNYWSLLGDYLSAKHQTPWGAAPNFDEGDSQSLVRRFVIDNAIYWLDEFHLDGLRVDAIHCMADDSEEHITREFGRELKAWAARADREIWLIAESNVYDDTMLRELDAGGNGFDAQWCDDFAHSLFSVVRPSEQLTVRTYEPGVDLAQTLKRGFIFQGDVQGYRGREDEVPDDRIDTSGLIYCLQNHDFIGNHPTGQRFHQLTSVEAQSAAAALLLLSPAIPMLFMGEEFACENPFAFFVDFGDENLKAAVVEGRQREYPQHDWSGGVLPTDELAFRSAQIGPVENGNALMRSWYQKLITLRKNSVRDVVLDGKYLEVKADIEQGLYALRYSHDSKELVVVTRLSATDQSRDPLSLNDLAERFGWKSISAETTEHSLAGTSEPFPVQSNHALVWVQN